MVLVDYREGSEQLIAPLQQLGLSVSKTTLEFGDIAFTGKGTAGASVDIGIEFKQFEELLQALRSGRFVGHQLPGMRVAYEFRYLVVEGEWKVDAQSGLLLTLQWVPKKKRKEWLPARPRMTANELDKQMLTLKLCGGLTDVQYTQDSVATLRAITILYHWFTDRDLDAHTSHIQIYRPAPLFPISNTQFILNGIPDVGLKVSGAAARKFGSVRKAVNASVEAWAALETKDGKGHLRRLGTKTAQKIVNTLGGE